MLRQLGPTARWTELPSRSGVRCHQGLAVAVAVAVAVVLVVVAAVVAVVVAAVADSDRVVP